MNKDKKGKAESLWHTLIVNGYKTKDSAVCAESFKLYFN